VTGEYFDRCQTARTTRVSHNETLQEELWATSVALTGVDADV
jgi:hypothetical protein